MDRVKLLQQLEFNELCLLILLFAHCSYTHTHTHTSRVPLSKAVDDVLRLLGLVVELSEGVEELLHLLLQSGIAQLCGGPAPFRLVDLSLDGAVPAPLLC